jgi:antirestriction protein ArdC
MLAFLTDDGSVWRCGFAPATRTSAIGALCWLDTVPTKTVLLGSLASTLAHLRPAKRFLGGAPESTPQESEGREAVATGSGGEEQLARPVAEIPDMDRTHCTSGASDRADIYTRITHEIVAAIEAGTHASCWKLPWHHDGSAIARPMNLASQKRYRGINILALWVAAMKFGYGSGLWGTYRQFAAAGAQVRKGERSTTVVFWKQFRIGDADHGTDEVSGSGGQHGDDRDDGYGRPRFMAKGYAVFNAAQVDGLDLSAQPALPETARIQAAEEFFGNLGISIRVEGDQACYVPSLDVVRIPPFARFRSAEVHAATTAHECAHNAVIRIMPHGLNLRLV